MGYTTYKEASVLSNQLDAITESPGRFGVFNTYGPGNQSYDIIKARSKKIWGVNDRDWANTSVKLDTAIDDFTMVMIEARGLVN